MNCDRYIEILHQEVRPAMGCTEPIAVAYAAARARRALGEIPERIEVFCSGNIIKNVMFVGIPGTDAKGIEIAAGMGALGGKDEQALNVLQGMTRQQIQAAKKMVEEGRVISCKADTPEKLYIRVLCISENGSSEVLIQGAHTHIVYVKKNDQIIWEAQPCQDMEQESSGEYHLALEEIVQFVNECPSQELEFLQEGIQMNMAMAQRGLEEGSGLGLGRILMENSIQISGGMDIYDYAGAMAAAAADARMTGVAMPVMSTAGSGNHGITATVPVAAMAERLNCSHEELLRAIALSDLVTVLVKESIGKLSAMCGCGIGASIGACCGMLYLQAGTVDEMCAAARNIVADVSGIICDGAKEGCALKIATAISSASRCAMLALQKRSVGSQNGIVTENFAQTIQNLGTLVHHGMKDTDDVILNIMMKKKQEGA